ncbi:fungal-specific transcription factor domain-containing protein [Geopyxis carbonaria]|nr:fungal-specific transcription factor domain-containing protein [Geopyxis carbonaria]
MEKHLSSLDPSSGGRVQGGFYVDSDEGARIPCSVRARKTSAVVVGVGSQSPVSIHPAEPPPYILGFPEWAHDLPQKLNGKNLQNRHQIDTGIYDTIHDYFERTCLGHGTPFATFETDRFPPMSFLNYFIQLYFDHFHPVFPVIHKGTLDLNSCHWLVALSLAALGSQYTDSPDLCRCIYPMQEFLRRAVCYEVRKSQDESEPELWLVQATLLNQIGMLYSGSTRLENIARQSHNKLVEYVRRSRLLSASSTLKESQDNYTEQDWSNWVYQEGSRRLGYSIWLVDCMMNFHFEQKPLLVLEDGQAPLPCNELLWDAEIATDSCKANPSLSNALQRIYVAKTVKHDVGEFSRVILLHGIFQETWAVARYYQRPLSSWIPSAERPDTPNPRPEQKVWLPEVPMFSKWRNAACDCIDVLHRAANSTISMLSGVEHPTVFHLHSARIVLLTPYSHIRKIAESLASPNTPATSDALATAEQEVLHWAQRDQRKARLAMIHAGGLLWHVRRYSTRAFYEPPAVFLCTLALWAYSSYTALASIPDGSASTIPSPSSSSARSSSSSSETPTSICLDRPNDDEIVQLFVRDGHPARMRAYISGVRNLCSPEAPARILKEGAKILTSMATTWGGAAGYVQLLERMVEARAAADDGEDVMQL